MLQAVNAKDPSGPNLIYSILELPRVMHEMSLIALAHGYLSRIKAGAGEPVMVLPGFGADDYSTSILRSYLNRWGFDARAWGIGQNLNPREMIDTESTLKQIENNLDQLAERLESIYVETGQKVALIGWSLGGLISRKLASNHPEMVGRVISMGTPFGDFRTTVVFPLMKRLLKGEVNDDDVQMWAELSNAPIGDIPLTVIYSKSDGFVPPENARDARSEIIEFVEVVCSHVGFGVHPSVFHLLANRLQVSSDDWSRFEPSLAERLVYKVS